MYEGSCSSIAFSRSLKLILRSLTGKGLDGSVIFVNWTEVLSMEAGSRPSLKRARMESPACRIDPSAGKISMRTGGVVSGEIVQV